MGTVTSTSLLTGRQSAYTITLVESERNCEAEALVRVVKQPEERRNEIMDVAQNLFESIGYEETSVNDIIKNAKIAKGTIYYYFKSKEEILDAVIERRMNIQIQCYTELLNNGNNAVEKLEQLIRENLKQNSAHVKLLEYLHRKENIVMHQKTLVESVKKLTPVIVRIIEQGIDEGVFDTCYPREVTEFVMVGMNFLFDPSIFSWSKSEYADRIKALAEIMERMLMAKKGSFAFLIELTDDYCAVLTS